MATEAANQDKEGASIPKRGRGRPQKRGPEVETGKKTVAVGKRKAEWPPTNAVMVEKKRRGHPSKKP
jgi:hypothetical protein